MRGRGLFAIVSVFVLFLVSACVKVEFSASGSEGILLVDKRFDDSKIVVGRELEVEVVVMNIGKNPVQDVHISNTPFDSDSFVIRFWGTKRRVGTIDPGKTAVVGFRVLPVREGRYPNSPVSVSYVDRNGIQNGVTSPPGGVFTVYNENTYNMHIKSHRIEWLIFFSMLVLLVALPASAYRNMKKRLKTK